MTETRRWLETHRRELEHWTASAWLAAMLGLVLGAFAGGALLARLGIYRTVPAAVFLAWFVAAAGAGIAWRWYRHRRRALAVPMLARVAERTGGVREGTIAGAAQWTVGAGSSALAGMADRRASAWLADRGRDALAGVRRRARNALLGGSGAFMLGAMLFIAARPLTGAGAQIWNPFGVVARARGPVELSVDRTTVPRGGRVTAVVQAAGRRSATLWLRAPGERWASTALELDSAGTATTVLGPLDSDRFVRASSGGRTSPTIRVEVLLPVFLADLELVARYPSYLSLPDELLAPSAAPVLLPVGTRIATRARATTELGTARWRSEQGSVALDVRGATLHGEFVVGRSAEWRLEVTTADGASLDGPPPVLDLVAVPDSAPTVSVPVPGADTVAPLTLKQPLVVDARDDYRVTSVAVVSWRVSRLGTVGDTVTVPIPLPDGGADRAVLHWLLDLNQRGLLPGDTLFFLVRARDNSPVGQIGESPVYRLRLASMAELRRATREGVRGAAAAADSVTEAQRDLVRQLEQLATQRERNETGARGGDARRRQTADQMPFRSVERAQELLEQQERLAERARALRDDVRELADAAWQAGLTDPEFQQQLRDLERLLDKALTDELTDRLEELRRAMERLDAPAVRDALERLAEQAQQLREELQRSRQLFERAAVEGELTALAEDADELTRRQAQWNETLAAERGADSALAAEEQQLSDETQRLADALTQLQSRLDSLGLAGDVSPQREGASQASGEMRRAARSAAQANRRGAREAGQAARQALAPIGPELRDERDRLRAAWRQEVMAALDRAMVEAADLAKSQQGVQRRLEQGETGGDVRGEQAAVREGVDRVRQRLQAAAGKNALIPPQLGAALGLGKLRMGEALDQLQRSTPNSREAAAAAGEALDALNHVIYALLQTQGDVAGAQSGTGLEEALERMAQLAEQQGGLNAETGGLLPLVPQGGEQLLQQLRALGERQRALAHELERLDAQGEVTGADALAQDAEQIARDLERGRLDRETIERQERLFRRLLDAGRTLRSDQEDEREERVSRTADPATVRPPPAELHAPPGGPRYRYPTWEELRLLSPEQRRLILDYFRRLNERAREPR